MTGKSSINNILILAGDSEGNLGDKAILHATCSDLLSINPKLSINIISRNNAPLPGIKNIHVIKPSYHGFMQLILTAWRVDMILCGGGGLFQDDDSLIKMPYWALRLLLMRLFCKKIIGYSLGVGPLSAASSRLFARLAFACMQHISTRDAIAQRVAQQLTGKSVTIVPDPALLLQGLSESQAADNDLIDSINQLNKPLIGVAVRRWFPPKIRLIPNIISAKFSSQKNTAVKQSEQLCTYFAQTLDQLATKHNASIIFMPSYNVSHESDDKLCLDIQKRMTTDATKILHIETPALYKTISSKLSVLLTGRMHPSIFAISSGTPIVGLAYNPKFLGFFSLLHLENYVMDVSDFVNLKLTNELAELTTNAIANTPNTDKELAHLREQIHAFNRLILGLES